MTTRSELIEAERKEVNLLINRGVSIEVETQVVKVEKRFGFLKKRVSTKEIQRFTIQEPTLSILDLISAEQIELKIDEKVMSSEDGISEARKLAREHTRRMARIVALSVLGQDYIIATNNGNHTRYHFDDKRLNELTDLFFHNIKPSKLLQYVILINTMSNLGDFTNSIRLMSAARTTMPILVEESQKV